MQNHPLKDMMDTSMSKLKDLVDVNTIIGDKIVTEDGKVIIPISKVSFGFGSGGTEFSVNSKSETKNEIKPMPFGGGGGGGVTITPIGFLVSDKNGVSLLELSGEGMNLEKVIDAVPGVVNKITDIFSKKEKSKTKIEVKENIK